ncbi:MAG: single-stranded-DNA-specific exonuclease RecJ [Anaerolineae bacterium]|nr:single-stranded-DNA-specific exonuclease RecJ [Anaerolineae bacterium]
MADSPSLTKRWRYAPLAPLDFVKALAPLHPIVAQIIYNRGHTDIEQARVFLDNTYELPWPFLLKDVNLAVDRISHAIAHREPVVVYGDFDVDGVTSTAILTSVLERLGADVRPYIPDRLTEGYGLNSESLKMLAGEGAKLVITVDCGVRSVQEAADAASYGMDMIITDHHSIGPELPSVCAVIDPKHPDSAYPFRELCGAGVVYALARALVARQSRHGAPPFDPDEYLDLVAIATVADVVPLVGENRYLVVEGLKRLNRTQRPGVRALMEVAGVSLGGVDSQSIGFRLGPRINAAGRLERAMIAYEMLVTRDPDLAQQRAEHLNEINRRRQDMTNAMQEIAAAEAGLSEKTAPPLIFAAHPEFHQGIVGLVASRLVEQAYRPAVVVQEGEEHSHASCRSIPEFHITEALDRCAGLLVRHGGHAAAAGFTVETSKIAALRERLVEIAAAQLGALDLTPTLHIDAEVRLGDLTEGLIEQLGRLEPTGERNDAPVLATRNLRVLAYRAVGQDGSHLKLFVADDANRMDAIAFRMGHRAGALPQCIDVAHHPEINEWNGRRSIQLVVHDIQPSEGLL